MRQIYEEACKEGTGKVYRTRIMLVGHFAAGKTSVKRSLLSEPFVQGHLSTEGVETEETVNVILTHVEEDKKELPYGRRCDQKPFSQMFLTVLWEITFPSRFNVQTHHMFICLPRI